MLLRSGKIVNMDQERVEYWRQLAASLGVKDADIPVFVAEQLRKEKAEEAEREHDRIRKDRELDHKMELERQAAENKRSMEQTEHQRRLSLLESSAGESRSLIDNQHRADYFRPTIPVFEEGKEDIETWLKRFERVASLCEWKAETWAIRISTQLTGKAAAVFSSLDEESVKDYAALKAALLARYKLTAETYRRRFRNGSRKDFETFCQFATRMEEDLTKWHDLSGLGDLRQLVLLEQFFQSLDADTAAFVKERKPQTVKEAAESAQVYLEAHSVQKESKPPRPPKAGQNQEHQGPADVAQASGCFACGAPDHIRRNCPRKKEKSVGVLSSDGGEEVQSGSVSISTLCAPCAKQHYDPHCFVWVEGKKVSALRDTGADVCMVRESLVSGLQRTGECLEVSMADRGVKRQFPVVKVRIDSPYFAGVVEAVVMKNPVADFVVGNHVRKGDSKVLPVYAVHKSFPAVTRAQEGSEETQLSSLRVEEPRISAFPSRREDRALRSVHDVAESEATSVSGKKGRVSFKGRDGSGNPERAEGDWRLRDTATPSNQKEKGCSSGRDFGSDCCRSRYRRGGYSDSGGSGCQGFGGSDRGGDRYRVHGSFGDRFRGSFGGNRRHGRYGNSDCSFGSWRFRRWDNDYYYRNDRRHGGAFGNCHGDRRGFEDPYSGWRKGRAGSQDGSQDTTKTKHRLNLKPRTKPVVPVKTESGHQASIFGSAKPVDTAVKDREIEERLVSRLPDVAQSSFLFLALLGVVWALSGCKNVGADYLSRVDQEDL